MIKAITRTRFILPLMATGAMMFGGCYKTDDKLHDYMSDKGCTQIALNNVLNSTQRDNINSQAVLRQSALDSMLYRDLFEATSLASDSSAVAEFNKIAAKASLCSAVANCYYTYAAIEDSSKNYFRRIVESEGKSIKEVEDAEAFFKKQTKNLACTDAGAASCQAASDRYFYGEFFADKKLLDDPEFASKFEKTAKYLAK